MQDTGFKAAAFSAVLVAGTSQFSGIDDLPKAWLVGAVIGLLSIVGFFAKRDYTRFNDAIVAINLRLAAHEKTLQDSATTEALGSAIGSSNKNIHGKINAVGKRLTVVEALLGMHGKIDLEVVDDESDDGGGDESAG